MTTPKLDEPINDRFLQTLAGRDDSTPLTLNQVSGLLQIAPETLRKRQRLGQVPPVWEDLRGLFPGLANAPVWRVRLGTMRALLAGVYTPTNAPAVMPTAGQGLPDRQLLDAVSAAADGGWHELPMAAVGAPATRLSPTFLPMARSRLRKPMGPGYLAVYVHGPTQATGGFLPSPDMSVTDDDACVWLTLDEYLTAVRIAAIAVPDEAYKKGRADYLASIPATVPDKERHRP